MNQPLSASETVSARPRVVSSSAPPGRAAPGSTTVVRAGLVGCLVAAFVLPVACGGSSSGSAGSAGGENAARDAGMDSRPAAGGFGADAGMGSTALRDAGVGAGVGAGLGRDAATNGAAPGSSDAGLRDAASARGDASASASTVSPWGASRDEQCAHAVRPTMNSGAQQAFDSGVAQAQRGELAPATTNFQRALQEDRQAYRAAYNLGVIADRQSREAEALDFYRQALRITPSFETAVEAVVLIHLRRGRNQEALTFVQPIALQFPWNDEIQATHSRVLAAMARWDEALRAARVGLSCDERSVAALTAVARAAFGQGNLELATWVLGTIVSVESTDTPGPSYAESHFLRGQIARGRPGELELAVREFERAVALRSDYVDARMALGQLLLSSGDYAQAVTHLGAAAAAAPWAWQVRLAHADALRSLRRYDEAKREIDGALALSPNQAEAHYSMGLLYLEQANCLRTGEASAIPVCQRALSELTAYRNGMGSRLPATDRSSEYIASLTRILGRLNAAAAAAREPQNGGGATEAP